MMLLVKSLASAKYKLAELMEKEAGYKLILCAFLTQCSTRGCCRTVSDKVSIIRTKIFSVKRKHFSAACELLTP